MVTLGLSTWSLHRTLSHGGLNLMDVPREMAARGLTELQICHFHLKAKDGVDAGYVAGLRQAMEASGVGCDALLLDFGDLSSESAGAEDEAEMMGWLDVAAALGARHARVSAGKGVPTEESLARVAEALLRLADRGQEVGVRVVTENWQEMMPSSREVLRLMELTGGKVPLCLDFGNWTGPGKYAELEAIALDAVTVHAKCAFPDDGGVSGAADFRRCLEILRDSDFEGAIALIYDGTSPEEWAHLERERDLVRAVFPA